MTAVLASLPTNHWLVRVLLNQRPYNDSDPPDTLLISLPISVWRQSMDLSTNHEGIRYGALAGVRL
jgi:hypothetical protein